MDHIIDSHHSLINARISELVEIKKILISQNEYGHVPELINAINELKMYLIRIQYGN